MMNKIPPIPIHHIYQIIAEVVIRRPGGILLEERVDACESAYVVVVFTHA